MPGWRIHPAEPAAGCLPTTQLAGCNPHPLDLSNSRVRDEAQLGNVLQRPPRSLASGLLSPQLGISTSRQTQRECFARFLWGSLFFFFPLPARVIYETRAASSLCRASLSLPAFLNPAGSTHFSEIPSTGVSMIYLFCFPTPPRPTGVAPLDISTQTNSILSRKDPFSVLPEPFSSPYSNILIYLNWP